MDAPVRVSVVIPSFNSVAFIRATLDSILGQTFQDFELVVADHSSTDGTWEALQDYQRDPRVRLVRTSPGGGAAANWNRVTDEACGEYLKLVPGDDLLFPTCLEQQVAVLDAHSSVDLVASRRAIVDEAGRTFVAARGLAGLKGLRPGHVAVRRAVLTGSNIFGEPGCVLLRRAALSAAGGWDGTDPFVIDLATYCRVLLRGDFFGIDQSLAAFRVSGSQWSQRLAEDQARHVMAFHRRLTAAHPGLLSAPAVWWGDVMARATATIRRATYVWLRLGTPGKRRSFTQRATR